MGDRKRMSRGTYSMYFGIAIVFDMLSLFIPGIDQLFIIFTKITFKMNGYAGGMKAVVAGVSAETAMDVIDFFTGLPDIMPGCMFFVWRFKSANHLATKDEEESN